MSSLRWLFRRVLLSLLVLEVVSLSQRSCYEPCAESHERVCGSDGIIYSSICHLRRSNCFLNGNTTPSSSSNCFSGQTKCQIERSETLNNLTNSAIEFVPTCDKSGRFQKVQCHITTGFCWCVNPTDGRPVPGTSTRSSKPLCRGRASKVRKAKQDADRSKTCDQPSRNEFNKNLLQHFIDDYYQSKNLTRTPHSSANRNNNASDVSLEAYEKEAIEWKFSNYDLNHDDYLARRELRRFRMDLKKKSKPKLCARHIVDYCDIDKDNRIGRNEWSVCLGVDINISFRLFLTLNADKKTTGNGNNNKQPDKPRKANLPNSGPWSFGGALTPSSSDSTDTATTREPRSCRTDRVEALKIHRDNLESGLYVPECDVKGTYKRTQCHKMTGYCWCVDTKTGRQVPGTSTHNKEPQCDEMKQQGIKGCSNALKAVLLTHLLDELTKQMVTYINNESSDKSILPVPDPNQTLEQRVIRWKFKLEDENNNEMLDKKELRKLRSDIRQSDSLRKCSRNFLRYCDSNKDSKVSLTEWFDCTEVDKDKEKNKISNPKRRGPNPFSVFLKSTDDA